jgi:phospholipid transport system substrate-binding protein
MASGRACVAAAAGDPVATIRTFYDALLTVMKAAKGLSFDQRYGRLAPAIDRAFNLALMTRIAVGPDWANLTQGQQQRLIAAFTRYTVSTYASRFDGYSGERFEVAPSPAPNPNGVIVDSRLVRGDGEPVTLNYLMRENGAGLWQVIDVFLSGTISELATRRSEFVAVLQRSGADGLLHLLERRSAALRAG